MSKVHINLEIEGLEEFKAAIDDMQEKAAALKAAAEKVEQLRLNLAVNRKSSQ